MDASYVIRGIWGILSERSFFMKKISGFFKAIGRYFKNFGVAFAKGDIWLSWVQGTSQGSRSSME